MLQSLLYLVLVAPLLASAQSLTLPTSGGSPKATVSERIGLTDISVSYSRPALRGRQGKVWGELVHYGFQPLDYGTSLAAPWRAGANESTVLATTTDLLIEGKRLPAGQYGLFMAVYPDSVSVIFSRNTTGWGSYFYDATADVLRVPVRPRKEQPLTERLTYSFDEQTDSTATLSLRWEQWQVPLRLAVDLRQTILASIRRELVSGKSEEYLNWVQAARYGLAHDIVNEEVLGWASQAILMPYIGQRNFLTLSTQAQVLSRLGRHAQADSLMREALPLGTMQEVHQYARQLLGQQRHADAMRVFQQNAKRYPDCFTTNVGLARGYAALNRAQDALRYAKAAHGQAPDEPNRQAVAQLIDQLAKERVGR